MNTNPIPRASSRGIKLHIVEDDPLLGQSLVNLAFSAVTEILLHSSAEDFLRSYDTGDHCALLLDVELPGMDGIRLLERLAAEHAMLPTLVMSADPSVRRVVAAMQHGAADFLPKPLDPQQLIDCIESLATKAPDLAQLRRRRQERQRAYERLTPREREVFDLLARGASTKQIASLLGMQLRTAHIHRTNVIRKFNVETPVELAHIAALLNCDSGQDQRDSISSCNG